MMPGTVEHEKTSPAGADNLAAEDTEARAHLVVDLVYRAERNLARELLLVLPVLVEQLAPAVEVAGGDGLEDFVPQLLDAMEAVGHPRMVGALLLLHGDVLVREHLAR